MPVRLTEKSRVVVELPMMMFLRLADGDGKMTAREMERFDELLASRDWCHSPLLQRSLANTEAEKAELWKQYTAGELRAGVDQVAASLDTILGSLAPEERPDVEHDLVQFSREILKAARAEAGLFHGDAEAKATFDTLLDLIKRPSARAAAQAKAKPAVETKPAAPNLCTLLTGDLSAEMFCRPGKLPVRCVQVIDETHDVKTFRFVADPPKLFRYYPGQFVTFEIPIDGNIVRRSYTISATPSRPHAVSVTVKRVENGQISNWLHDNLRPGSTLFLNGPNGTFTCIPDDAGPFLFLSGGSGITPVMSMSRWLSDTTPDADILFLHFARSPDDLIFAHELQLMERNLPGFRCQFVCSQAGEGSGWTGPTGRISPESLTQLVPDLKSRSVYLCGPVPFMDAARGMLEQLGFDMTRFHQEIFGGVPRRDPGAAEAQAGTLAKLVFSHSKIEFDCKGSDYILDIALDHGLDVAYSCRAGQCGTCKVTLLEGSVEHDCKNALTPDDEKEGHILACQARPIGRVVLDL
jgi:glycine betaine catabolism B